LSSRVATADEDKNCNECRAQSRRPLAQQSLRAASGPH
jgi:hypothetical protein